MASIKFEENILALMEEKQLRNVEYFNRYIGSLSGKRGRVKHEFMSHRMGPPRRNKRRWKSNVRMHL